MHQQEQLTTYFTKNIVSCIIMQKKSRTTTTIMLLTDWIFFRPISLCVSEEAPASLFFISHYYFVCRIWSMHQESSPPLANAVEPEATLQPFDNRHPSIRLNVAVVF